MHISKKIILIILLLFNFNLFLGAKTFNATPQKVYRVYLGGQSLGVIKSKKSLTAKFLKKEM